MVSRLRYRYFQSLEWMLNHVSEEKQCSGCLFFKRGFLLWCFVLTRAGHGEEASNWSSLLCLFHRVDSRHLKVKTIIFEHEHPFETRCLLSSGQREHCERAVPFRFCTLYASFPLNLEQSVFVLITNKSIKLGRTHCHRSFIYVNS